MNQQEKHTEEERILRARLNKTIAPTTTEKSRRIALNMLVARVRDLRKGRINRWEGRKLTELEKTLMESLLRERKMRFIAIGTIFTVSLAMLLASYLHLPR